MKFKNVQIFGLESSIIRSGLPMQTEEPEEISNCPEFDYDREHRLSRAKKLANTPAGSGHSNFRKGIIVQFDILYTQYFAQQLQRYNFVDIISSQSKMHKLTSVKDIGDNCNKYVFKSFIEELNNLICIYNEIDMKDGDTGYYYTNDSSNESYEFNSKNELFHYIISNLPMGYQLWMGVSTNYEQLATIYRQRCKHKHKLEDWAEFGEFIESLPMSELITNNK